MFHAVYAALHQCKSSAAVASMSQRSDGLADRCVLCSLRKSCKTRAWRPPPGGRCGARARRPAAGAPPPPPPLPRPPPRPGEPPRRPPRRRPPRGLRPAPAPLPAIRQGSAADAAHVIVETQHPQTDGSLVSRCQPDGNTIRQLTEESTCKGSPSSKAQLPLGMRAKCIVASS